MHHVTKFRRSIANGTFGTFELSCTRVLSAKCPKRTCFLTRIDPSVRFGRIFLAQNWSWRTTDRQTTDRRTENLESSLHSRPKGNSIFRLHCTLWEWSQVDEMMAKLMRWTDDRRKYWSTPIWVISWLHSFRSRNPLLRAPSFWDSISATIELNFRSRNFTQLVAPAAPSAVTEPQRHSSYVHGTDTKPAITAAPSSDDRSLNGISRTASRNFTEPG